METPREHLIARYFLEALEPSGWLGKSLNEIHVETNVEYDDLKNVLIKLQGAEPTGLFSRNLSECLRLQILDKGLMCDELSTLLENLSLLGKGDLKSLIKKIGCDETKIKGFLAIIRSRPQARFFIPYRDFKYAQTRSIGKKSGENWMVDLNRSTLPSININEDYARKLSPGGRDNTKIESYASQALSSARWLKRALEQRNITTLKITAEIIKRQTDFLEKGMDFLAPLSLKDMRWQ